VSTDSVVGLDRVLTRKGEPLTVWAPVYWCRRRRKGRRAL